MAKKSPEERIANIQEMIHKNSEKIVKLRKLNRLLEIQADELKSAVPQSEMTDVQKKEHRLEQSTRDKNKFQDSLKSVELGSISSDPYKSDL